MILLALALTTQTGGPISDPVSPFRWSCNLDMIIQGDYGTAGTCPVNPNGPCLPGPPSPFEGAHRAYEIDVGDWDGQGPPDILLGAGRGLWKPSFTSTNSKSGSFVVHTSGPAAWAGNRDDSAASLRVLSPNAGDLLGWSVAFVGDIDDDGLDDIIAGAPRGPLPTGGNATFEGRAYLFLSSDTALLTPTWGGTGCRTATTYPGWHTLADAASIEIEPFADDLDTALFPNPQPLFGWAVAGAGDIDSDGTPDLAIGAPGQDDRLATSDAPHNFPGRLYLLSGSKLMAAWAADSGPGPAVVEASEAMTCEGWTHSDGLGAAGMDRMGFSIAANGDVNGDGNPDLVVGAPQFRWRGAASDFVQGTFESTGEGYARLITSTPGANGSPPTYAQLQFGDGWFINKSDNNPAYPAAPTGTDAVHSYGEAFGYSVAIRKSATSQANLWDIVVGSPLWSSPATDEAGAIIFETTALRNEINPNWFVWGPSLRGENGLEVAGRFSTWQLSTTGTPQVSRTAERFGEDRERLGWNVDAAGKLNGGNAADFAVCRRGATISGLGSNQCTSPTFQEGEGLSPCNATTPAPNTTIPTGAVDPNTGGPSCGLLEVYDGATLLVLRRIAGEDPKDSVGWSYRAVPDQDGDGLNEMLADSPRWPGDNGLKWPTPPPETYFPHQELVEAGRAYLYLSTSSQY